MGMSEANLLEALAAHEHEVWTNWVAHMLPNLTDENVERWKRQMVTPYAELTEREKDSDRKIARQFLDALKQAGFQVVPL